MTAGVNIVFKGASLKKLLTKLPDALQENINDAGYQYTRKVSKALRLAAITDPLRPITADRQMAAAKIRAKKISKFKSVVEMPHSLIMLDSMSPHYVPLKRGRNITAWANKYYGTKRIAGRSKVYRGPRGGIVYSDGVRSNIFVTPHKFVQKTLTKQRNKLPNELRKGLTKAMQASRA